MGTGQSGLFGADAGSGWVTAYCDGGARGNPGPAGYGVHMVDENGVVLAQLSEFLGLKTNNFAEYNGLLGALGYALKSGVRKLRVVSDSELMVKQMKGQYKVSSPDLRPLYEEAKKRARGLEAFEIRHVLRGKNKEADRLANLAMDRGMSRAPGQVVRADAYARPPVMVAGGKTASGTAAGPGEGETGRGAKPEERAEAARIAIPEKLAGVVQDGVVRLLDGKLPEGTRVVVTPEK